jgi:hypothetical protein
MVDFKDMREKGQNQVVASRLWSIQPAFPFI